MTAPDVRDTALPDSPRALEAARKWAREDIRRGREEGRSGSLMDALVPAFLAGAAYVLTETGHLKLAALADDRSGAVPPALTDEQRGLIAYRLTRYLVIDMPTARAAVDAALAAGSLQASTASPGGEKL